MSKVTKRASFQRERSFPVFIVSPERRGVSTARVAECSLQTVLGRTPAQLGSTHTFDSDVGHCSK